MSDVPSNPPPSTAAEEINFRVVQIEDVTFDFSAASAVVSLREAEGRRRLLRLPVALGDATSIHQAWLRVPGRRPATSELVTFLLGELQADIIAARIVRMDQGVYFGEFDVMTPRGRRVFDCRPSDAIVLAVRQAVPAPVLVADDLLWAR